MEWGRFRPLVSTSLEQTTWSTMKEVIVRYQLLATGRHCHCHYLSCCLVHRAFSRQICKNSGNKEKMAGNPLSIADTMPASIASVRFPATSLTASYTWQVNEERAEWRGMTDHLNKEGILWDGSYGKVWTTPWIMIVSMVGWHDDRPWLWFDMQHAPQILGLTWPLQQQQ